MILLQIQARSNRNYGKNLCGIGQGQDVFGDEWIDRLLELEGAQAERQMFQCPQAGFRLGAQLMLEALGT